MWKTPPLLYVQAHDINAGIVRVIIRNTKDSFTSVNVDDWIYNDEP